MKAQRNEREGHNQSRQGRKGVILRRYSPLVQEFPRIVGLPR